MASHTNATQQFADVIKRAGLLEFCRQVLQKPTYQMMLFALSFLQKNIAQHICVAVLAKILSDRLFSYLVTLGKEYEEEKL